MVSFLSAHVLVMLLSPAVWAAYGVVVDRREDCVVSIVWVRANVSDTL